MGSWFGGQYVNDYGSVLIPNPSPIMVVTSLASTWITALAIDHSPALLS